MAKDERSPDADAPGVGRRRFVRQLAGDAVGTAGRLAGMSHVVHDSMVAAGRAFTEGMESIGEAPRGTRPAGPASHPAAPARPVEITPEIRRVLERARTGVMAVNQPDDAPQMSVSIVRFDGESFRIPGRAMTARVANLQRDPRATLAITDEGESVVITGRVELVYGEEAKAGLGAADAAASVAPGDVPVLIVLRPERIVRRRVEAPGS
jgi:hypothetical protein